MNSKFLNNPISVHILTLSEIPPQCFSYFCSSFLLASATLNANSSSGAGDWCSQVCRTNRCLSEALHCRHNEPETFTAVQEKSLLNILSSSIIKHRHCVKSKRFLNAPESRNRLVLIAQTVPLNILFPCEENMQKLKMQLISLFLLIQTSYSWILLTLISLRNTQEC